MKTFKQLREETDNIDPKDHKQAFDLLRDWNDKLDKPLTPGQLIMIDWLDNLAYSNVVYIDFKAKRRLAA